MGASVTRGSTAEHLVLGGLLIETAQVALFIVLGGLAPRGPLFGSILFDLGAIGAVWLVLTFLLSYRRLRDGNREGARAPTFVFALLSILTVYVIAGILLILAYHELGPAPNPNAPLRTPLAPAPLRSGSKVCGICGKANALSSPVCQGCGILLDR